MRYITICAGILLVMLACGKDKPETKPSIKIKSISGNIVPVNGNLNITLEFSDKEGDVNDSLFLKKIRLNTIPPVSGITIRDSFYLMIPDFPAKSNGDIELRLGYQDVISASNPPVDPTDPAKKVSDTIIMKFALQDKGGNTSDTIETEKIVILRN